LAKEGDDGLHVLEQCVRATQRNNHLLKVCGPKVHIDRSLLESESAHAHVGDLEILEEIIY
jgi:hypothetical protein